MLPGSNGLIPGEGPSEICRLAMVAVAYDPMDGDIKGTIARFHRLREPSHPIPAAATAIHGLTDDVVKGHRITSPDITEWIASTMTMVQGDVALGSRDIEKLPLLIAHNAGFDRKMLEMLFPQVAELPWACSQTQVPWSDHGYEGTKLSYLGVRAGFFYGDHHSALADADAVVELLRQPLGDVSAMAQLCDAARRAAHRIYVVTR